MYVCATVLQGLYLPLRQHCWCKEHKAGTHAPSARPVHGRRSNATRLRVPLLCSARCSQRQLPPAASSAAQGPTPKEQFNAAASTQGCKLGLNHARLTAPLPPLPSAVDPRRARDAARQRHGTACTIRHHHTRMLSKGLFATYTSTALAACINKGLFATYTSNALAACINKGLFATYTSNALCGLHQIKCLFATYTSNALAACIKSEAADASRCFWKRPEKSRACLSMVMIGQGTRPP